MTERRSHGTIKQLDPQQGFGFIQCPELQAVFGKDVFLHAKQAGTFAVGAEVSFAVALNSESRPQAYDLQPASGSSEQPVQREVQQPPPPPPTMVMPTMAMGVNAKGGMSGKGGKGPAGKGFKGGDGTWGGPPGWDAWGAESWGQPTWSDAGWAPPPTWQEPGWESQSSWGGPGQWADPGASRKRKSSVADLESEVLGQFSGHIQTYNDQNGFGFIQCAALKQQGYQKDVFLHKSQLRDFQLHSPVTFTAYINPNGQLRAKDLMPDGRGGMSGW